MSEERQDRWALYIGIGMVALGLWFLVEKIAGPWLTPIRQAWRTVQGLGWPVAIIIIGILLIVGFPRIRAAEFKGRRIYRSRTDKILGGVLSGVAKFIGTDPTWVRLGYVLFAILVDVGPAVVLYIIASIIIPKEPEGSDEIIVDPVFVTAAPPAAPSPAPAPPVPPIPGDESQQ